MAAPTVPAKPTAGRLLSGLFGLLLALTAQGFLLAVPVWLFANRGLAGLGAQLAYMQTFWLVLAAQSLFLPFFVIILAMWTSLKKQSTRGLI